MSDKPVIEIDGARFRTLNGFYDEIERALLGPGVRWGRNLDAFNDVLRGGFGITPAGGFVIRWRRSARSRERLGVGRGGQQLFDTLVEIIRVHGPGGEEAEDGVDLELL
ncbi:ribonuclease inhibitor [Enhygromyxa salina]|uniref:Ribonuclease inhibitor n=1 Tax=Enhygromyxa salina TaxID=215803 RepID=A0A0C2CZX2_9BACT|nr:barstar family protein [Enhygromyxa salina]KIG13422.1 ribonuclease inhibitor [Enhygromyxa salina]